MKKKNPLNKKSSGDRLRQLQNTRKVTKRFYTSCFSIDGNNKRSISISRGTPKWFKGKVYLPLAPPWELVLLYKNKKINQKEYTTRYRKILKGLNPNRVVKDIPDQSILLCWEDPGDFCHRQLVAQWLNRVKGVTVFEYAEKRLEEFFEF